MPEQRYTVRPVQVIYICDEPDCDEQQIATIGFTDSWGTQWTHRCQNGHVLEHMGYDVKYPRLEYVQEEWPIGLKAIQDLSGG